jgi:hypothetical protein
VQDILKSISPHLPSLRENVRTKWKKMLKKALASPGALTITDDRHDIDHDDGGDGNDRGNDDHDDHDDDRDDDGDDDHPHSHSHAHGHGLPLAATSS